MNIMNHIIYYIISYNFNLNSSFCAVKMRQVGGGGTVRLLLLLLLPLLLLAIRRARSPPPPTQPRGQLRFAAPAEDALLPPGEVYFQLDVLPPSAADNADTANAVDTTDTTRDAATPLRIVFELHGGEEYTFEVPQSGEFKHRIGVHIKDPGSHFAVVYYADRRTGVPLLETSATLSFEVCYTQASMDAMAAAATALDHSPRSAAAPPLPPPPLPRGDRYDRVTDALLEIRATALSFAPPRPQKINIVHVCDLGTMDGYKGYLLQQLIRLPRGVYAQSIVDLSCVTDPSMQPFRAELVAWDLPFFSECIMVPSAHDYADGWHSIAEWHHDLRALDRMASLDEAPPLMRQALAGLVARLRAADVLVLTNGANDYDSYLVALGRLTKTRVILDLGPKGPESLPWTTRGLDVFVAQSAFVRHAPRVVASGVPVVTLPPVVDFEAFSLPEARRTCLRSPLTSPPLAAADSNSIRSSSNAVTVSYVARIAAQKGPGMFVRAAAEAQSRRNPAAGDPPLRFIMAGAGPLRDKVEALARRLGVWDSIEWTGFVRNDEVRCVLARTDVFVFSSLFHESFGMSAVEAMLMRRAVVGFGIGGSREFLLDGDTAVLAAAHTPAALADAVLGLARDPSRREALGRRAEDFVRAQYAPQQTLRRLRALYHVLLEGGRGGGTPEEAQQRQQDEL